MNKLLKNLYDCFYTPLELPAQKQEIEECHQALIEALEKPERRLVLQIIDAKDRIVEDTSIDSFISGFELAWQFSISYSLLCRWFKVAVLPLDAALCAEITKGRDEIKRCAVCGAAFTPNSNRAKYCPDCAVQVRRKKEAERQRKRYLLSTHLGR